MTYKTKIMNVRDDFEYCSNVVYVAHGSQKVEWLQVYRFIWKLSFFEKKIFSMARISVE